MFKTKVTNESNNTIILKEGNAGEFCALGTLQKDASMTMSVSANATYREYWFAVDPGTSEDKIILTSDDCMDLKEIKIIEEDNKIGWTGTPRKKPEAGSKSKETVFSRIGRFVRYLSNLVRCLSEQRIKVTIRLYGDNFLALVLNCIDSICCIVDALLYYIPSDSDIHSVYGE